MPSQAELQRVARQKGVEEGEEEEQQAGRRDRQQDRAQLRWKKAKRPNPVSLMPKKKVKPGHNARGADSSGGSRQPPQPQGGGSAAAAAASGGGSAAATAVAAPSAGLLARVRSALRDFK